jgi:hypothetical protein
MTPFSAVRLPLKAHSAVVSLLLLLKPPALLGDVVSFVAVVSAPEV